MALAGVEVEMHVYKAGAFDHSTNPVCCSVVYLVQENLSTTKHSRSFLFALLKKSKKA